MDLTLQQIKYNYSKSKGYRDFDELMYYANTEHINDLLILVQRECLKKASDNAYTKDVKYSNDVEVDRESITDEDNVIK